MTATVLSLGFLRQAAQKGSEPRLCAVARREDGSGFLITAYPTDAVKAGESVGTRSK